MFSYIDPSEQRTVVASSKRLEATIDGRIINLSSSSSSRSIMVKQSDRAPLLDWEEIPPPDPNQACPPPAQPPPVSLPRDEDAPPRKKSSQASGRRAATDALTGTGWSSKSTAIACTPAKCGTAVVARGDGGSGRPQTVLCGQPLGRDRAVPFPGLLVRDQWEEKDQIVAVFVVTFDTRSGR